MQPSPAFTIGPFEIFESADRGGMAEVWRGVHRSQRVPVALKVLTGRDATHPNFIAAFRNEVMAVAALDHPHIIHIYDHGVIDGEIERRTEGALPAGSPYFVMEWASGGHLSSSARPRSWKALKGALNALLDALSHAHARGVVHRDLKRQNVLMCGPNDLRPGWKLADFGMVRFGIRPDVLAGGTAGLMSPEQESGLWRDQGPWTDLYSLGCLAWVMVTGKKGELRPPPAQLVKAPPERTQIAVPKAMWHWIARLTETNHADRPRFAAQARAWLNALGEPDANDEARATEPEESEEAAESNPTTGRTRTVVLVAVPSSPKEKATRAAADQRLPIPLDWRTSQARGSSSPLHGAGLSLFSYRNLPMVGREDVRDRLWEGLCSVATTGRPRCAILRGPAGTGKTALARWLSWRGHEMGAAETLEVTHEAMPGPSDGIGPMLARRLVCNELSRDDVLARLDDFAAEGVIPDRRDVPALLDLVCPDESGSYESAGNGSAGRDAARRLIASIASTHPVILWIDDAQYDATSIEFASRVLETHAPVYVVVCVREEEVATRQDIGARLVELARHQDVQAIDVPPLRGAAWRQMVREILGLDGALAAQLEERAAGNPMFAVHLVRDWVSRGLLVPGEGGFRLAPRVQVEFPEDLHAVWRAHLEALLAGRPEEDALALEVAATLGQEVSMVEWHAACDVAGLPLPPQQLVNALQGRRLARIAVVGKEGRWSFAHAMVRESLVKRAQEAGRLAGHHATCAEVLARGASHPAAVERRARHLLGAEHLDRALDPLLRSARMRLASGERDGAAALVSEVARAVDHLSLPDAHPARVELGLVRAELAGLRGQAAEEAKSAGEAARAAVSSGDQALAGRALHRLGVGLRETGELRESVHTLTRAGEMARASQAHTTEALCLAERGRVRTLLGEDAEAFADLARAERFFRSAKDSAGIAASLLGLAAATRYQGAFTRAAGYARNALGYVELSGSRRLLGDVLVELGDIARGQGDLTAAEGWYHTAQERARVAGTDPLGAQVGLALSLVERGQCGEAQTVLFELLDVARMAGRRLIVVRVRLALVVCAAKAGEWTRWDEQVAAVRSDLRSTEYIDPDVRTLCRRAKALAQGAGEIFRGNAVGSLPESRTDLRLAVLSA